MIADHFVALEALTTPPPGVPVEEGLQKLTTKYLEENGNSSNASTLKLPEPLEPVAWFRFVSILLSKLLQLQNDLKVADDKESLLNTKQQAVLKKSLELVIVFGLVKHLDKGIGISLAQRSGAFKEVAIHPLSDEQKVLCINFVVEHVLTLKSDDPFRSLILTNYFGDILAGLFQILLAKNVPQEMRHSCKNTLNNLIENTSQTLVIRQLMLLMGNKSCPNRLGRALRGVLSERLIKDGGVAATIKAILEENAEPSSPNFWQSVQVLSKLIAAPHTKTELVSSYYCSVYSQVLSLLITCQQHYIQVCVSTVKAIREHSLDRFNEFILSPITQPLTTVSSSEQSINNSIDSLHKLVGVPASDAWHLTPDVLPADVKLALINLYVRVTNSIFFNKNKVEDIVWAILNNTHLTDTLSLFIYSDSSEIDYVFGPEGGIMTVNSESQISCEDRAECLYQLLVKRDCDNTLKPKAYNALLKMFASGGLTTASKATIADLLAKLSSEECVVKNLHKNPEPLVSFLTELLSCVEVDEDLLAVGLMVLSVILSSGTCDWSVFTPLVDPLKVIKNTSPNCELKVLAEEVYSMIYTHGVVRSQVLKPSQTDTNQQIRLLKENLKAVGFAEKSVFDTALEEAVDELLPVRAHGIRELSKLLREGNKQALGKQEALFTLFKENLKDEDSYLYLSAIDGLSSLAAVFPDRVLLTLTEQFVYCKDGQVRLKLGEVLLKLIKSLGCLVAKYKVELLNALLNGCKDEDHLVRASSLSNIGELCQTLGFQVGTIIVEVFDVIRRIFETDKHVEPRRSAILVLTCIIKGLGSDALNVLEPVLLDLYKKLKLIYEHEEDDVTRLHAQLALEELNQCTKNYLFPSQPSQLSKRIFVLDPPL